MLDQIPNEQVADIELSQQAERIRYHLNNVLEAYRGSLSHEKIKDGKEYLITVENALMDAYEALTGETL